MPILQHYYTSFINKETKSAGFQVKAMSPGISPETQLTIARLITYRIPSTYYEQEVTSHPIALRYLYQPGEESILLCSQSNGNDENGRPGNFFAHTLVMNSHSFTSVPPIFYWRSVFWCKQDSGPARALAPLERAQMEPTLDIEEVWRFLAPPERRAQFFRLMCAVVQSKQTQRRIVIIDSADHVALWIAAVSAVLPPLYRPLLSFATYHHDPYQSPFLITGTTTDSFFRALPEEYVTYFILNAALGKVSDVAPSSYAKMAVDAADTDFYETELLPIFSRYAIRFPQPTDIDEKLDQIVAYARVYTPGRGDPFTEDMIQAIATALSTFEQIEPSHYKYSELSELSRLGYILLDAYKQGPNPLIKNLYMRTTKLLSRHIKPTDENIVELLKFCTTSFLESSAELSEVAFTIDDLCKIYKEDVLTDCINSTAYMSYLDRFLTTAPTPFLLFCWQQLGDYLMPGPDTRPLLLTSLRTWNELWKQKHNDSERLFRAMSRAFTVHEQGVNWFSLAVEVYDELPKKALEQFYCKFVSPLELERRLSYRHIVQRVLHDIIIAELHYDIHTNSPERALLQLERWERHSKHFALEPAHLVQIYGLPELAKCCRSRQWQNLMLEILMNDELAPLLAPEVKQNYLQNAFAIASFTSLSEEKVRLYQKYQNEPVLSINVHIIAPILLGLADGQLDTEKIHPLHTYMQGVPAESYAFEIGACIAKLFTADASKEIHNQVIQALFIPMRRNEFWKVYWEQLIMLLTHPTQITRALDLLSCWFEMLEVPTTFQHSLLPQDFFLQLPLQLTRIKKSNHYQELVAAIDMKAVKRPWYPSIRPYLVRQKNSLWSPFPFTKFSYTAKKSEGEQVSKHVLSTNITKMFEYSHLATTGDLYEYHVKNIPLVYTLQQSELFWQCYWSEFEKLLIQCHKNKKEAFFEYIGVILKLLAFWFDEALPVLGHVPYVVQEFFLETSQRLQATNKHSEFKEVLHHIDKICKSDPQQYGWWFLIKSVVNIQ